MVSLVLETPDLLFGAYVCCVGTLAGLVLNSVPRNPKLNQVSFVYIVLAAASSLHILFCKPFCSLHDPLSLHFLMKPFRGLAIPSFACYICPRLQYFSTSSPGTCNLSRSRLVGVRPDSRRLQFVATYVHQRYDHRNVTILVDGEPLHIHPRHFYDPVVLER